MKFLRITLLSLLLLTECGKTLNLNRVKGIKGPNYPKIVDNGVIFAVDVPQASYVTIAGSFNGWNPQVTPLTNTNGLWMILLDLKPGKTYSYKFVIDGFWVADPDNPDTRSDGYGSVNSVIKIPEK